MRSYQRGSQLAEYGIVMALVALVCISQLGNVGHTIADQGESLNGFIAAGVAGGGQGTNLTQTSSPLQNTPVSAQPIQNTTGDTSPTANAGTSMQAGWNTASLASNVEVSGSSGTIAQLAAQLQSLSNIASNLESQDAQNLQTLAKKGYFLATQVKKMEDGYKASIKIGDDTSLSPAEALAKAEPLVAHETDITLAYQNFLTEYNALRSSLVSASPSLQKEVSGLVSNISTTTDTFNTTISEFKSNYFYGENKTLDNLPGNINAHVASNMIRTDSSQIENAH